MALQTSTVWEVRTGGNDNNGGGFTSGGTDFSQQDSPQLALTDITTTGFGTITITSATGGFTSAMVGNLLQLVSGTNAVTGFYEIVTFTDTNNVDLDRTPDSGVGISGDGVVNVGGGLASVGEAAGALINDNVVHVAGGTYTLTTITPNISGGGIDITTGGIGSQWYGYNSTRGDLDSTSDTTNNPILDVVALTSFTVINQLAGTGDTELGLMSHITVDGQTNSSVNGFSQDADNVYVSCKALDCAVGFGGNGILAGCYYCYADNCSTAGFSDAKTFRCVARGCAIGFRADANSNHIFGLAYNCTAQGFFADDDHAYFFGCTAVDNTNDGFHADAAGLNQFVACLSAFNGGYGFGADNEGGAGGSLMLQCATFSNTSGAVEFTGTAGFRQIDTITLSSDPFSNRAADDYNLNNTAGGGADLRNAVFQLATQTDEFDIGAVQHIESVSAAPFFVTRDTGLKGR